MVPRFLAVFLVAVFSFSSLPVEATNISIKSQFKSCCCKTGVCRCQQHAGPEACPLQKNLRILKTHKNSGQDIPFLTAVGCGSHGEKSQLPNSLMQDFDIKNASFQFVLNQNTHSPDSNVSFHFLFEHLIERPPRISSLPLSI